jgi:hypothetical protein
MANKLYFIKPNDWEVCHLHHWGVIQTSWSGIELQLGESGYYECDISELYTTENIENNPILYLQLNHNGKDSVFNSTETNNGEARLNDMSGRIYEVQYVGDKLFFKKPSDWTSLWAYVYDNKVFTGFIELTKGTNYYEWDISQFLPSGSEETTLHFLLVDTSDGTWYGKYHQSMDLSVEIPTKLGNVFGLKEEKLVDVGNIHDANFRDTVLYFKKPATWKQLYIYWKVSSDYAMWNMRALSVGESGYYEWDILEVVGDNIIYYLSDFPESNLTEKTPVLNLHQSDDIGKIFETINIDSTKLDGWVTNYIGDYTIKRDYSKAELVCVGRITEEEPKPEEPKPDVPVEPDEPTEEPVVFPCGLMQYLPEYWHSNVEMQEILKRQCEEFKLYVLSQEPVFTDSFILQASENRVVEWEKKLGITANGTLDERRQVIFGMLYSIRKLDEATIKELVKLNCSNADCNVRIKNSNIDVEVLPTSHNDYYNFANLNRVLNIKKPAHLGLKVYFYECTWGEIKKNFSTWNDVKTYGNWSDVNTYLAYLEG